MSQLFVDDVVSKEGTNSVGFSKGINVSVASTFSGAVTIGGTLTYEDVTNVEATGIITAKSGIKLGAAGIGGTFNANGDVTLAGVVTATSFSGAATGLTGVPGGQITGALAAVDGSALTGMANTANVSTSDLMVIGVGTFFGNRVLIQNTSGPVLELATNTGSNDSSIHLHEGAVGSTNNGGAVIYSGSNNKLSICCGTTLTTERIGIARDSGEVNIGSGVTISSAGVSTFSSDVNVGSAVTVYASSGIVSATSFHGDGSNLSGLSGGFSNMAVLTSGTSWSIPAGVTKIKVFCTGAGGGGGKGTNEISAGSGGAGGTSIHYFDTSAGGSATYAIGVGGNYSASTSSGRVTRGGNGGTASGGTLNLTGGAGSSGYSNTDGNERVAPVMAGASYWGGTGTPGGKEDSSNPVGSPSNIGCGGIGGKNWNANSGSDGLIVIEY